MQHPPTALAYRPEIDGLRALAVTIVVLFHAGLGFAGGFVGVDIFFVISGYLITSLLLKSLDAGDFSLAAFYERRARRILPASLTMTALVLAAAYRFVLPSDFRWYGLSAVAHAACCANFYFRWRTSNYFAGGAAEMPLLHTWSLAVEEQFYLAFPLILWACYRLAGWRSRRAIGVVLGVLGMVSLGLSVRGVAVDPNGAFYLLPGRAWELVCGAMLAVVPACRASRTVREGVSWIGLAAMVGPVLVYSSATPFPGLAAVPPCVGTALVIWSCGGAGGRQAWLGRALASPVPVFVGAISYSLYLYHWPILVLANYWSVGSRPVSFRLLLVGLSFAAAVVSWWLVERPFRVRRVCRSRRSVFVAAAGGLVTVIAGGGVVYHKDGVPSRFARTVNDLDAVRRESLHLAQHQAADAEAGRLTPMGVADAGAPVSVLLWGDSHAGSAFQAFNDYCKARGLNGRAATHSAVAPLLDYAIDPSADVRRAMVAYNRAVVDYVAREHVRTVFLVDYWQRDADHDPRELAAALGRTLDALRQAGAVVYVVMEWPSYSIEVPKALAYEAIHGRPLAGWRKTLAEHRAGQKTMDDLALRYAAADRHFIDPAPAFLRRGEPTLTVADHGRPVYHDAHHLSVWGAKRVLRAFLEAAVPTP